LGWSVIKIEARFEPAAFAKDVSRQLGRVAPRRGGEPVLRVVRSWRRGKGAFNGPRCAGGAMKLP
jgi:hypothetical protein